jgi:hypothetical protein
MNISNGRTKPPVGPFSNHADNFLGIIFFLSLFNKYLQTLETTLNWNLSSLKLDVKT